MRRLALIWAALIASLAAASSAGAVGAAAAAGAPALPARFVLAAPIPHTHDDELQIRSAQTGRVLASFARYPGRGFPYTDFALPAAGSSVYASLPGPRLEIYAVHPGGRTGIVPGYTPALDASGGQLAYLTPGHPPHIAIKDLHTGAVRTVDVSALLGSSAFIGDAGAGWLGDGDLAVVLPVPGGCRGQATSLLFCAVIVHVPRSGPLTATGYTIPGIRFGDDDGSPLVAAATGDPAGLTLGVDGLSFAIDTVSFAGSRAEVHTAARVHQGILLALAPGGNAILYRDIGERLYRAALGRSGLSGRTQLASGSLAFAGAW